MEKLNTSTIISNILSFLLSLILTLLIALVCIKIGFFRSNTIPNLLDSVDYYRMATDYAYTQVEAYSVPSGVDIADFDDIVTLKNSEELGKAYIESALSGEIQEIDATSLSEQLLSNITDELDVSIDQITDDEKAALDDFVTQSIKLYTDAIKFPFMTLYNKALTMYNKVVTIGVPIMALLSLFIILLIVKINTWKHKAIRSLVYAFFAAAIMVLVVPLYVLISKVYMRLSFEPEQLYLAATSFIRNGMIVFVIAGLIMLLIGFVGIEVSSTLRKKAKRKK